MRKFDLLSGGFLLTLALVICGLSLQFDVGQLNSPGPGFYPLTCGLSLGVFSILIILQALKQSHTVVRFWSTGANKKRIVTAFGIILLYALMLEPLGFVATTITFFLLISRFVSGHGWKTASFFSATATLCIYVVFRYLLHAPLPHGLLEGIL